MAKINWKTEEETLEKIKKDKIDELSRICSEKISYFEDDGYKYSYEVENQMNFEATSKLFDNNMIKEINWNAYINEKKTRIKLNKEEFQKLYLKGIKHKADCLSRLNDVLIPLVKEAETKEVVGRIYWDENLDSPEMIIKEDKTINKQVDSLNKTTQSLQASSMTTMMALVQVSGMIK